MPEPSHITLRQGAWDGDAEVSLPVPSRWQVTHMQLDEPRVDRVHMVRRALAAPYGAPALSTLAQGRRRAGIVIDDLTRPTRVDEILPELLAHLSRGGIRPEDVTLFVATGSHEAPPPDDLLRKAGPALREVGRVVVHDCHGSCHDLGTTDRGTPVLVNSDLMTCDLKIGIGSVFPHPAAAFSGGAKTVVPGMCGAATIRFLHDHVRPAQRRGGDVHCDLRREVHRIAAMIGLDFVVLALPGMDRRAVSIIAGRAEEAFEEAVGAYRAIARVPFPDPGDLDAVILDAYPFDGTLQFAHDRALWPLHLLPAGIPVVLIARCSRGAGTHEFFPAADPVRQRLLRRLSHVRLHDLRRIREIVANARYLFNERRRPVIVVAEGVSDRDVRRVFPRGTLCSSWDAACAHLDGLWTTRSGRVACIHTAPLLLPLVGGKDS